MSPTLSLLLTCAAHAADVPVASSVTAEVVVDATAGDGSLGVTMRWHGLSGANQSFRPYGDGSYAYSDVQIRNADGVVPHLEEGGAYSFTATGDVELSYRVRPGGKGRHGRQGAVEADWAVVDGRTFMAPRGALDPARIAVEFTLPEGWVAATPFTERDGSYVIEPQGTLTAGRALQESCFGLGRYEAVRGEGFTSWAYAGWSPEHRAQLGENTGRMVSWFRDNVGLEHPFTVVWTPLSGGERVFGGAHGQGTCYEFPPEVGERRASRNWQLLGHRLAHAQNKYPPYSLVIRDGQDHWFVEGWAAYAEVLSTEALGLSPPGAPLELLHRRHHQVIAREPSWAQPLAIEPRMPVETHEFVHYTEAPLAAAQLDFWMRARSGVQLQQLVKSLNQTHGAERGTVALREAVEAFTKDDYDDFFALFIDRPLPAVPVWEQALGEVNPVVGTAAGAPVDSALVQALARSGRVERWSQLRDWLLDAELALAELERRGVRLAPDAVLRERNRLSGRAHLDLLTAAHDFPMHLAPDPPARGCLGGQTLPERRWRADTASDTGMLLDGLMATEGREEPVGVERIAVRFAKEPREATLVVGERDDLQLMVKWLAPPSEIEVELLQDGTSVTTKTLVLEPGWARTWSTFPASVRQPGESLLELRVRAGGVERAVHRVWQVPGSLQ